MTVNQVIETRFQFFESGVGLAAARLGVIPIDLLTKYDSYKTYLDFIAKGHNRAESIILASDQCRVHRSTIWRAIDWFEGVTEEPPVKRSRKRSDAALQRHGHLQMPAQ